MLFNSYPFILLFLPVVLAGYFWLGQRSNLIPVIWLALASLAGVAAMLVWAAGADARLEAGVSAELAR